MTISQLFNVLAAPVTTVIFFVHGIYLIRYAPTRQADEVAEERQRKPNRFDSERDIERRLKYMESEGYLWFLRSGGILEIVVSIGLAVLLISGKL